MSPMKRLTMLLGLLAMCCCCSGVIITRNPGTYGAQVVSTAIIQGMERLLGTLRVGRVHPEGTSLTGVLQMGRLGSVALRFSYLTNSCVLSTAPGGVVDGRMLQSAFIAIVRMYYDTMVEEGAAYFYAEVGRVAVEYFQVTGPGSTYLSVNTTVVATSPAQINNSSDASTSWFSSSTPTMESLEFKLQDLMYPPGSTTDCYMFGSTLVSGPAEHPYTVLANGAYLQSPNQQFILSMQLDCNLVLYNAHAGPTWSSKTNGLGTGCQLYMQTDGNLVVYDNNNEALWSSKTNCVPWPCVVPAALMIEDDGILVIYQTDTQQCLWSSIVY